MRYFLAYMLMCGVALADMNVIGKTATVVGDGHRIDADTTGKLSTMPESIYTNCVLWQAFSHDDDSGTNYYDLSTSGNDGVQATANSQPAWTNDAGGSYYFVTDDYIESTSLNGFNTSVGAIMWWSKVNDVAGNYSPVGLSEASGTATLLLLYNRDSNDSFEIQLTTDSTLQFQARTAIDSLDAHVDTWLHIAVVQNGTEVSIYFNGILMPLVWTVTTDKTKWFSDLIGASTAADTYAIGALAYNGGILFPFSGGIDDVIIYNRVPSSNEVYTVATETAH